MDWFGENPWLAWLGIALVLGAIEAATVDFVFLMLAGGALIAAIEAAFGVPFAVQVVSFVLVAALLLIVLRPFLTRHLIVSDVGNTIGARSLLGRTGRVLQVVTPNDGRVKLAGEVWSARTHDVGVTLQPGQEVRVVSIEGATVIVTSVTAGQKSE